MFDSKDLRGRIDYMKKANSTRNISKGLGISPSTISRVLNHPELVKESTRVAVFDYLQKNNLELPRQNKVKTNTIGLTFSDPTSFFTSEVISALERNLVDTKYHLMLFNLRSRRDVYEYFMEHPEYLRKVDALIISSSTLSEKGSEFLQKLGIPVVLFHSQCPGERCILTNNFRGGRDAATFILSRGYALGIPTTDQLTKGLASTKTMTTWPQEGSILELEDEIVVYLSEPTEKWYAVNGIQ